MNEERISQKLPGSKRIFLIYNRQGHAYSEQKRVGNQFYPSIINGDNSFGSGGTLTNFSLHHTVVNSETNYL